MLDIETFSLLTPILTERIAKLIPIEHQNDGDSLKESIQQTVTILSQLRPVTPYYAKQIINFLEYALFAINQPPLDASEPAPQGLVSYFQSSFSRISATANKSPAHQNKVSAEQIESIKSLFFESLNPLCAQSSKQLQQHPQPFPANTEPILKTLPAAMTGNHRCSLPVTFPTPTQFELCILLNLLGYGPYTLNYHEPYRSNTAIDPLHVCLLNTSARHLGSIQAFSVEIMKLTHSQALFEKLLIPLYKKTLIPDHFQQALLVQFLACQKIPRHLQTSIAQSLSFNFTHVSPSTVTQKIRQLEEKLTPEDREQAQGDTRMTKNANHTIAFIRHSQDQAGWKVINGQDHVGPTGLTWLDKLIPYCNFHHITYFIPDLIPVVNDGQNDVEAEDDDITTTNRPGQLFSSHTTIIKFPNERVRLIHWRTYSNRSHEPPEKGLATMRVEYLLAYEPTQDPSVVPVKCLESNISFHQWRSLNTLKNSPLVTEESMTRFTGDWLTVPNTDSPSTTLKSNPTPRPFILWRWLKAIGSWLVKLWRWFFPERTQPLYPKTDWLSETQPDLFTTIKWEVPRMPCTPGATAHHCTVSKGSH